MVIRTYLHLVIFAAILITITTLLLTASVDSEKRGIIIDYLAKEAIHIQNIDLAKLEYLNIVGVFENNQDDEKLRNQLIKRPFKIFKDEKYILGKDKDRMLAELEGMPGSIDEEILLLGQSIHNWCESVKDDTISSFSITTEGDLKFHNLMKVRDQLLTLKRMYASNQVTILDFFLLGIPLLASLVGLLGQAYSAYKEFKAEKINRDKTQIA